MKKKKNNINHQELRILKLQKKKFHGIPITHYQTTNFRQVQIESRQTTILNLMKIVEISLNR